MNTNNYEFQKVELLDIDNTNIHPLARVKKTIQGDIIEITYTSHRTQGATIRKIDSDSYEVISTGEIKQYNKENKEKNRTDNVKELKRSMAKLRALINCNVGSENIKNVRWITLTYAENMQDTKKLYNDYKKLWQKLKRKYGNDLAYILAVEPQERGAWHIHLLLIFPTTAPYIVNEELAKMWGNGFVTVKSIDNNVDNLGAYLTAYLTDIPVENNDNSTEKKYIKGGRLSYYPTGMQFYRHSKNIKYPEDIDCEYQDNQELNKCSLTYKKAFAIHYDENNPEKKITVIKEYYNTNRRRENGDKHYIPNYRAEQKELKIKYGFEFIGTGIPEIDNCRYADDLFADAPEYVEYF